MVVAYFAMPSFQQFAALGLGLLFIIDGSACKRRAKPDSKRAALPPLEAPTTAPANSDLPATVYDAGSTAERKAAERDRLFKRWVGAFVGGAPAAKAQAKAELEKQPADVQAAFRKFCDVNGVKID